MDLFSIIAIVITLAAVFAWINHKLLKLPTTIGVMLIALLASLGMILVGLQNPGLEQHAERMLERVDFGDTLLYGMLGYLLFAGALHVDLSALRRQRLVIAMLATVGILISTGIIASFMYGAFWLLGVEVRLIYCLLFGALISPTDPIAVLAILKTMGAPKTLETKITGESLFNDGVGVVLFLVLLQIATAGGSVAGDTAHAEAAPTDTSQLVQAEEPAQAPLPADDAVDGSDTPAPQDTTEASGEAPAAPSEEGHSPTSDGHHPAEPITAMGIAQLFVIEVGGGALLGLVLGLLAFAMLRSVDSYQVEILLSLALVTGGYALATALHLSGPIAVVIAGLLIGNHGRLLAMSPTTISHLDDFWELIDEVLNAVLFVLIGLELLVIVFTLPAIIAGLIAIPVGLFARFVAVGLAVSVLRNFREFTPHAVKLLTWGGLRGGISVALALSIPKTIDGQLVPERELLLTATYIVVIFSIAVQGLTMGPMLRRLVPPGAMQEDEQAVAP